MAEKNNEVLFGRQTQLMNALKNKAKYALSSDFSLKEDELYLDILKNLYSEFVDVETKLEGLYLLQEESAYLLNTPEKVEQVVGTLHSLFNESLQNNFFRGQVLVTATVVLLTSNHNHSNDLIYKHRELLFSATEDEVKPLVRSFACQCLIELETTFEGILIENYDQIKRISNNLKKMSAINTAAVLLSTVIKNSATEKMDFQAIRKYSDPSSSPKIQRDFVPLVLTLVDVLPSLCPVSRHNTLLNIIPFWMKRDSLMVIATLKMWLPQLRHSSNMTLLHTALILPDLDLNPDESICFLSLVSQHPTLQAVHRLLLMDWLETLLSINTTQSLDSLMPGPFDGIDISTKILSLSVASATCQDRLTAHISCLKKLVSTSPRNTRIIFRSIFWMWKKMNSPSLENHICMISIAVIERSISLIVFLVDFIRSVKSHEPDCTLVTLLWTAILNRLSSLPLQDASVNIQYVLLCIDSANNMNEPVKTIQSFLDCLTDMLEHCSNLKRDWLIGNSILIVLTSLLKRTDISLLYGLLGRILHSMLSETNKTDCDVASRAKFCYAALTSLTSNKVRQLFHSEIKSNRPLTSDKSRLFMESPMVQNCPSFLCIDRINPPVPNKTVLYSNYYEKGGLNSYLDWISVSRRTIPIHLNIKYITEPIDDAWRKLYALNVNIHVANESCALTSSKEIPTISYGEEKQIVLDASPVVVCPIRLNFSIEFTTAQGKSYSSLIPSEVVLPLEYFFLPIAWPECDQTRLFNDLWKRIESENENCVCVHFSSSKLILDKWKVFEIVCEETDRFKFAMFLCPKTHLLIQCQVQTEGVRIDMETENIALLNWFNVYLSQIDT